MEPHTNPSHSFRPLERALLLTFAIHAAAMVGMVACLLPGVPGGSGSDVAARATYVMNHPWLWHLGWAGWQATAASDLLLSIALVQCRAIPKAPAIFALAATLLALLPDQIGQLVWSFFGPSMAADAVHRGDFTLYAAREKHLFQALGGWGAGLYLIAAIGWTVCLQGASIWSAALRGLSIGVWSIFAIAVALLCLPTDRWTPLTLSAAGAVNAVAFVLLLFWIAEAGEQTLGKTHPPMPRWAYPNRTAFGRIWNMLANSRFLERLFEPVPGLAMRSDIRDVIYVNYLVDAARLAQHVPPPLQLQTLGPDGRYALLTILVYRHGHFGPRSFGPLRAAWPSPVQSNWRAYVTDPQSGRSGVLFLTTTISALPYAFAARWLSVNVPMHLPAQSDVRLLDGRWHARIDPGRGSAPDLSLDLRPAPDEPWPPPFSEAFADSQALLAYCVPQNRALIARPWRGLITRQEISLDIPLDQCQPLAGEVRSTAAATFGGEGESFCFYVPKVRFFYAGQAHDRITAPPTSPP